MNIPKTNDDLRHYGEIGNPGLFLFSAPQRACAFGGLLVLLLLMLGVLPAIGWIGERTEQARIADAARKDTRLDRLLAQTKCPPPKEPLEKLLITIGTQADGKPPIITCSYITADLGVVPRVRHHQPVIAQRSM